jgi:hypothetical protein
MQKMPSDQQGRITENPQELVSAIPSGTIYSYNLDDSKTPGGMKVRWKVRVVSGKEAQRWDARQAEAIRELLQWAHRRQHRTSQ